MVSEIIMVAHVDFADHFIDGLIYLYQFGLFTFKWNWAMHVQRAIVGSLQPLYPQRLQ